MQKVKRKKRWVWVTQQKYRTPAWACSNGVGKAKGQLDLEKESKKGFYKHTNCERTTK